MLPCLTNLSFSVSSIVGGNNLDTGYNRLFARYSKRINNAKQLNKQNDERKVLQIFNNYLTLLNKDKMMYMGFI